MDEQTVLLPVTGMSCANCAANMERSLKKLAGVTSASVNFASETAGVTFVPGRVSQEQLVDQIHKAGFGVVEQTRQFPVQGMSCANCAMNIERTLNKKTPGVTRASVNFAAETVSVTYVPGITDLDRIAGAIEKIGFTPILSEEEDEEGKDAEQRARAAEIRDQTRKFWVGIVFTLPLFVLSMGRDFGLFGTWSHGAWVNFLFLALASPVQFYTGFDYYTGAFKSLKNMTANMDVLVALGSSTAYVYSLAVLFLPGLGGHVYFETSAVIITLIKLGKMLEARTKGRTGQAIRKLMDLSPKTARILDGDVEKNRAPGKGENRGQGGGAAR